MLVRLGVLVGTVAVSVTVLVAVLVAVRVFVDVACAVVSAAIAVAGTVATVCVVAFVTGCVAICVAGFVAVVACAVVLIGAAVVAARVDTAVGGGVADRVPTALTVVASCATIVRVGRMTEVVATTLGTVVGGLALWVACPVGTPTTSVPTLVTAGVAGACDTLATGVAFVATRVAVAVDTERVSVRTIPNVRASASVPIAASATITSLPTSRRCMSYSFGACCAMQGDDQLKRTADAGRAVQPDMPAVYFGERPRNRQAHARIA